MNLEKMGKLIAELRREKKMTQKDLADQLNITDKAVSKWERGLSGPDISLLTPLADILEITVSELLNGEKKVSVNEEIEENLNNAITYTEKIVSQKNNKFRSICAGLFSVSLFVAFIVCVICDYSISQRLSWSLYPISSMFFAWIVIFPLIRLPKNGVMVSLISLSLFIIPFLYVIDRLVKTSKYILPIGIRASIISICFLWIIYGLFKFFQNRKLLALGIAFILGSVFCLLINAVVSKVLLEPIIDIWDIFSCILLLSAGFFCCIKDGRKRNSLFVNSKGVQ